MHPRQWVTLATITKDYTDGGSLDSSIFDMTTGTGRIVLDRFVNSDNTYAGNIFFDWKIMGSATSVVEASGMCQDPTTTTSSTGPGSTTTLHPGSPTDPRCTPSYEADFDVKPGTYFARLGAPPSYRWTVRIQELR